MDDYFSDKSIKNSDFRDQVDRRVKAIIDYAIDKFKGPHIETPPPKDAISILMRDWLKCSVSDVNTESFNFESVDRNLTAYAFHKCVSNEISSLECCELEECSAQFGIELALNDPFKCVKEDIEIGLNATKFIPVKGCVLVIHKPSGQRAFVTYDLCYNEIGCSFTVNSNQGDFDIAKCLKQNIESVKNTENFYDKACVMFGSGKLSFIEHGSTAWDQIFIPENIKNLILRNSFNLIKNSELIYSRGFLPNRNLLLVSPPGMAKSTIFKALSNQLDGMATRIWCTGKSIRSGQDVTDLFTCARALAPCVLFVEDMDLFGKDRESLTANGYILNEFLNCLDGLHENPGIVVMASTNDHDSMDKALTNRPGRFDVKIKLPHPTKLERTSILSNQLLRYGLKPDKSISRDDFDNVLDMTEGMTGAYLNEIAKVCFLNAIDRTQNSQCDIFSINDLRDACQQVMDNLNMSGC